MSEPLDDLTIRRLAYTEAQKTRVKMIDLPAVAQDIRLGTLHPRARLPVVRQPPNQCSQCGEGFWPRGTTQIYCGMDCREKAKGLARRTKPPKIPFNVRPERDRAVAAVCAVWSNVTAGMILGPSRCVPVVRPRQAAYRLTLDQRKGASRSDVARAFNRDHTTILSGLRKHAQCMAEPEYAGRFEAARLLIRSAIP